jgi:hypothetical protein
MSKKQTISVPLIADPRGVNIPIQEMQEALAALTWLQYSYGQAFRNVTEVDGSRYVMPQVYAGNREFLSVEPDDSTSAFSFFEVIDQGTKAFEFADEWVQRVNLVVYCNLEVINQVEGVNRDYIFTEELKEEVTSIIREGNLSFIDGETFIIERGIENAFSNYSYWTFDERYIKRNYDAFKLSFEIRFNDQCINDVVAIDVDYQALLDYWTLQGFTLPTPAHQTSQNQHVIDLKAAGLWDSMDFYHVYANDNIDIAKTNWKNPGTYDAIEVNAPTFTAIQGFNSDGFSSWLGTSYNPFLGGVNYTLNDAAIGVYALTDSTGPDYYIGNGDSRIRKRSDGPNRINSTSTYSFAHLTMGAVQSVSRDSATTISASSGQTVVNISNTSTGISNATMEILSSGLGSAPYDGIVSMAFSGSNITGKQAQLDTIFNTYISAL